jgi:hypothetical protein
MITLTVNTVPTENLNVHKINIDLGDFDPHTGISFICTLFNQSNIIIDRQYVTMTGADWQDWGPSDIAQDDYDYVIGVVLTSLNVTKAEN